MAMEKLKIAPGEAPKLDDYLCFATYSANLAFSRVYKPMLDELGLTYPQYLVLIALYEQDGQTVGGLGGRLFLDSSTLTPLLKRMEGMGYLTRQRDPKDERQVRVSLTRRGRALREEGLALRDAFEEATGLGPAASRQLREAVMRLRQSLWAAANAEG